MNPGLLRIYRIHKPGLDHAQQHGRVAGVFLYSLLPGGPSFMIFSSEGTTVVRSWKK